MPRDLPHRVPTIGRDAMAKPLLALSHSNEPLAVTIPGDIIYTT